MSARIQTAPTAGLSYSPLDEHYFDPAALAPELERVYDICHGCRLCFNLCPSFPALFDAVDGHDGDVRALTAAESDRVVDHCFQCKICYIKCPYSPDENHQFQLDFPRLMARAKAVRVKKEGLRFRERLLGSPDLLGKFARLAPWLVNLANRLAPNRWLLQWVLGIHRRKALPNFHGRTFQAWFERNYRAGEGAGNNGKVFLFQTCFVNFNNPEIGEAAVEVLSRNQVEVVCDYRRCCGMPALDGGDVAAAQRMARENIAQLVPYVRQGYRILAINPTCSMMFRKEYPELVGGEDAKALAEAVRDPSEFLNELRKDGRLDGDFRSTPGLINYHVPCHLRAQNIGYRSRDLMRSIGGETEVELVAECCGHDGTWAMKKENFEASMKVGKKAFQGMEKGDGCLVTDCPLAAIHFEQALGKRPLHPLQVLARAYRQEGFAKSVAPEKET